MSDVLFIHHSIGRQLIDGGLRDRLAAHPQPIRLWDHDYNEIGLTDPDGRPSGRSFPVPDDDTDPQGLVRLVEALGNGRLEVPDHDVLVLKSCFPNNAIGSDDQVTGLIDTYGSLREAAAGLSAHVLLLSTPPLVREATNAAQVRRAAFVAEWLRQIWPGPGLAVADLFGLLAYRRGPLRGTLRTAYRARRPRDSHLSPAGARAGSAFLAGAIRDAVLAARRPSTPRPSTEPR